MCVSGWEEAHKARHVCVWREACHVCECEWQVWDGESEEREATRVDSVGGGCGGHGAHTATHTHQRGCHHSAPLCLVPPRTHAHTQRTGRGSGHSGGGWWEWGTVVVAATPHTHTATTTTCPPPRVCVCEWQGRGQHQHSQWVDQVATHATTPTLPPPHPPPPAAAARGGVVWCGAQGVGGLVSGEPGAATANTVATHTLTHEAPKWTSHHACVCVAWWCAMPVCV